MNQEESEQNEVDGMKKGADSTGKATHMFAVFLRGLAFSYRVSSDPALSFPRND